jgi:hypothetical protein
MAVPVRLSTTFLAVLLAATGWVGCGANTGLPIHGRLHDSGILANDAGVDAGADAAVECVEVPLDGGPVNASMRLQAQVGRADVVFLIDVTSSMDAEIARVRARLRDRIAPAIRAAIPDSQLAVATFGDFPAGEYGMAEFDVPFTLMSPSTADIARVQAAVDSVSIGSGGDQPESQVEALYQLATGEGLIDPRKAGAFYVTPSTGCPSGGRGYACIRRDAVPVVLLFTDAVMHEGPNPSDRRAYSRSVLGFSLGSGIGPHTFANAVSELVALDARVIGFDSGGGAGAPDLRTLATQTGTVDAFGRPLVLDIGSSGERLTEEVVGAIQTFASTVIQDIDAVVRDADASDGVDARMLVEYVEPVSATPMSGIGSIDVVNHVFVDATVGTELTFRLVVRSGIAVPGPEPRFVTIEVVFRGNGRTRLGSVIVRLLVPAADGRGCESLGQ